MGFKTFIKSKKILSLLAVFMLSGTHLLMAQDAAAPATAATGDAADAAPACPLATACAELAAAIARRARRWLLLLRPRS